MDNISTAEHITKDFTRHRALDDVSVSVPRGKVYGLHGHNGAGKTTLIRIINHITAPDSGSVTFNGHPLTEKGDTMSQEPSVACERQTEARTPKWWK